MTPSDPLRHRHPARPVRLHYLQPPLARRYTTAMCIALLPAVHHLRCDCSHPRELTRSRQRLLRGRRGHAYFAVGQLCHYTLDANPDADGDARERLTLAFSTADVFVTGARLALLLEPLHQQRLASVPAMDARYANAGAPKPWIANIVISRLDKSSGAAG